MSELTPQEQLEKAYLSETSKIIKATKNDIQTLAKYARTIIKDKDIKVTERLHYFKKFVQKLGKAGLAFNEKQLRQILGEQRRVLNGSSEAWKGGDKLKYNPAPFMWHGVVMKNTTTLVVSLPKVGKSRLFTQMYGQLVKGNDSFLGQGLQAEIPKIYISGGDQPDEDWALCLKLAGLLESGTDKLHKNIIQLHTKNKNPLHLDEKGIDIITEACEAAYPKRILIVLDSYHSHVAPLGLAEKDEAYAVPLEDLQESIAPYKPTLIIIHHANKNSSGQDDAVLASRGTGALPGAVSQIVYMYKMQKESPLAPKDDRVKLVTSSRASKPLDLLIEQVNDGYDWKLHGDAATVSRRDAVQGIVDALNERQRLAIEDIATHWQATGCGMDAEALADALDLQGANPPARAREVMATLEKNHLIQKCGDKPAKGDGGGQAKKLFRPTKAAIDLFGQSNV